MNFTELNNYINENINVSKNYNDNVIVLSKLINLLSNKDLDSSDSDLINLVKNNKKLNLMIKTIKDYYGEIISSDDIFNVIKDVNILTLLKVYTDLNGIVLGEEITEEKLSNDVNNSTVSYLNEIGDYSLLTKEEEIELSKRIEQNDEEALKILIEHNLKLVVYVAKKYLSMGIDFQDLIQEGNIGLISAAKKFDYRKDCRFSTYAIWWIRQAILSKIPEYRSVRVPNHVEEDYRKIIKAENILSFKLNREATMEEVAAYLKCPIEKISNIKNAYLDVISLDLPVGEDKDSKLGDLIQDEKYNSPEEEISFNMFHEVLSQYIDTLPQREKEIIMYRYPLDGSKPLTLEEIGKKYNVSRERIRQQEVMGLSRLRKLTEFRVMANDYIPDLNLIPNYYEHIKKLTR